MLTNRKCSGHTVRICMLIWTYVSNCIKTLFISCALNMYLVHVGSTISSMKHHSKTQIIILFGFLIFQKLAFSISRTQLALERIIPKEGNLWKYRPKLIIADSVRLSSEKKKIKCNKPYVPSPT